MAVLDDAMLQWIVAAVPGTTVSAVRGLRDGGSPWLVSLTGPTALDVVLRLGSAAERSGLATEVAALEHAAAHGVPAPRLIAEDLTGEVSPGLLAVLTTRIAGASRVTAEPTRARLRAMGAAVAAIHEVPLPSSPALPLRDRPINDVDFGALRRAEPAQPLLEEAERVLAQLPAPPPQVVFVHGDFWHGNTLWEDDTLTGLVDWDRAGVGPPGVDLGSLRCDAALCAGPDAADEALAGYEAATGRPAQDVAYWDLVAGLSTPPTMGWFVGAIQGQGRVDLDQPTLLARRDAFVSDAIDRLS